MSNELLPCPFCGTTTIAWTSVPRGVELICTGCHIHGCEADTQEESARLWNRRFVCLDKHGEKVFAGDDVKVSGKLLGEPETTKAVHEPCVLFEGHPVAICDLMINHCDIELIKEDKE